MADALSRNLKISEDKEEDQISLPILAVNYILYLLCLISYEYLQDLHLHVDSKITAVNTSEF